MISVTIDGVPDETLRGSPKSNRYMCAKFADALAIAATRSTSPEEAADIGWGIAALAAIANHPSTPTVVVTMRRDQ